MIRLGTRDWEKLYGMDKGKVEHDKEIKINKKAKEPKNQMMLTPNQLKVFDFINSYIKKKGTALRYERYCKQGCTFKHLEDLKKHRKNEDILRSTI